MNFSDMTFRRKFSMNMYKDHSVSLAKMTFTCDFVSTVRGDVYTLIEKSPDVTEHVCASGYSISSEGGSVERLFAAFFPFATYKMDIDSLLGRAGFVFVSGDTKAEVYVEREDWDSAIVMKEGDNTETVSLQPNMSKTFTLAVTCRPGAFDVYTVTDGIFTHIHSFSAKSFSGSNRESFYKQAKANVKLSGQVVITGVESCVDCGIGQADIRPFRYENGDVIVENGRVFLTFSARGEAGGYQGIFSWLPGTADFRMEGAVFYDTGSGITHGDVATAYVYDRREAKWFMWQRSGGAGHIPAFATFTGDVRFGVNVVDVTPLEKLPEGATDDTPLLGKKGDEDPDFMFDESRGKWLLALCRVTNKTNKYQYYFYESDSPISGYKYIGEGPAGEETGGSIVKLDGKIYFVCGNSFSDTSSYRVYEWGKFDTFTKLKTDFPDGGFRGWGTVMPVTVGTRRRFFWLTFDRKLLSSIGYNWSYGNVYCFEADEYEVVKA